MSSTSPLITSLGIGTNGLDLNSLLSKQVAAESVPLTNIQAATTKLQTQLSALGQVQSAVSTLRDAASTLTSPSTWGATQVSSSDATAVTATSDSTAATGNVAVTVTQLATSQTLASNAFANTTDSVGSGTLTIQLGTWASDGSFTAKSGSNPTAITVASGSNSLTAIRDSINGANAGVTASIVTDSSGSRLVMTSNATGQSAGFKVTATDADGNGSDASGLSALAYDPSSSITSMTQKQSAGNAIATVNGLDINSESNTLSTVVPGMTLTLLKPSSSAQISVTSNTTAIQANITSFVTAYNALMGMLHDQTKYDSSNQTAGTLQGDNTVVDIENQLRGIGGGSTNLAGAFTRLADIGLDPGEDGQLTVDNGKLTAALADPTDLKQFFMGVDKSTTDGSNNGFAQQVQSFGDTMLSIDGSLMSHEAGVQARITDNNQQATDEQARIDLFQQRLTQQYNALDTTMGSLNSLASYVQQQFGSSSTTK